jgi:hypothetical protein
LLANGIEMARQEKVSNVARRNGVEKPEQNDDSKKKG